MDIRLIPAAAFAWLAAWWLTKPIKAAGFVLPLVAMLIISLVILYFLRTSELNRRITIITHFALVTSGILAVTLSVNNYQQNASAFISELPDNVAVTIIGTVVTEPRKAAFGDSYVYTVSEATRHIEAEVTGSKQPFRSVVEATGKYKAGEPGRKEAFRLTAKQIEVIEEPAIWWRATNSLREDLMSVTANLSPQGSGLVPGMAIGDTSRLTPELKTAFKVSGLSHLTAVSGGHFAIILMALTYITGGLRLNRWLRVLSFAFISLAFVMLVRPDPAVIRAAAMCGVSIIATMLGRKAMAMPALGASILVLLAIDPWLSRSFGFALSCAASGSLACFSTPLAGKLKPWLGEKLAFLVAVPLTAQVACAPILILFSQGAATTTTLANLLVGPAVAPATLLSLAATLLVPAWPWGATWVAKTAGVATGWIAWVALRCSALPFALIPVPSGIPGSIMLVIITVVIGLLVARWHPKGWPDSFRRKVTDQKKSWTLYSKAGLRRFQLGIPNHKDKWVFYGAIVGALVLLFGLSWGGTTVLVSRHGALPNDWQVAACDVGQGDGMVIRTGAHSGIVVDTGNDDGAIGHCLEQLAINRIDLLVLSHFHSDHVGGVRSALAGRSVGGVIGPGGCGGEAASVYQALAANGAVLQTATTGNSGEIGNVRWLTFGISLPDAEQRTCARTKNAEDSETELNNKSIALVAYIGSGDEQINLIALGDLETQGQTELLAQLHSELSVAHFDIVKVAHHGSAKQSPALARYLSPDAAVFSVGAHNTYGHPTVKALSLYQEAGAVDVRTDQCGTAVFSKRHRELLLTCLRQ